MVPNPDGSEDIITFGSGAHVPNAMVFDKNGNLYVSDSFQGAIFRILKLDLTKPALSAGAVSIFAESINGADGIAFDRRSRLWVAANQADEVVGLNAKGKVVAKLGDFQGIRNDGSPRGLLFPASLVILDDEMFVTNLALPLNGTTGDEPEEDVTRYRVSRMKIPHH